jgi:hypothetical protein
MRLNDTHKGRGAFSAMVGLFEDSTQQKEAPS